MSGVSVYIDDISITGQTEEEHLDNLSEVLAGAGMRLKREKCAFLLQSVDYLGHVISANGILPVKLLNSVYRSGYGVKVWTSPSGRSSNCQEC